MGHNGKEGLSEDSEQRLVRGLTSAINAYVTMFMFAHCARVFLHTRPADEQRAKRIHRNGGPFIDKYSVCPLHRH